MTNPPAPATRGQSSSTRGPGHSFANGNGPVWGISDNELWVGVTVPGGR